MKIKAKISICGIVNMKPGEIKDINEATAQDMISAGYAESMEPEIATSQNDEVSEETASIDVPVKKRGRKSEDK